MNQKSSQPTDYIQDDAQEHFIPIALEELIPQLIQSAQWTSEQDSQLFEDFCHGLISLYHAQFHAHFRFLKQCYQPFNPDQDTSTARAEIDFDSVTATTQFVERIKFVLEKANYVLLSSDELNRAMQKTSPYGVEVSVNFDDFDEIALFYRGRATRVTYQRNWKQLWLSKQEIETPVYRRMLLLLKPKIAEQLDSSAKKRVWESESLTIGGKQQGAIVLKLFKDIPHSDLEMLFPNIHIRMRLFDKLKIGLTGGGGTIGGVSSTITKVAATADPLAIATAIFGFAGLVWRQVVKVFTQRTKYMAKLAQSLYYYNLDNNSGAISYLINLAEAEECKETILTYFTLLTQGSCTAREVDAHVESFLSRLGAGGTDFEISDGLAKLEQLGLLESDDSKQLSVVDLESALQKLETSWQQTFNREVDNSQFEEVFKKRTRANH